MIDRKLAYIAADGKPVPCIQLRRNKEDKVRRNSVIMDEVGNIDHPPIARLACFGRPVEYYRGLSDRPAIYDGNETPRWCAGCPSRPACAETADKRVNAVPELVGKRSAWEAATDRVSPAARYIHPTFTEFAVACDEQKWTSTNDDRLDAQRTAHDKKMRKDRDRAKRKVKRGRTVTPAVQQALDQELDRRRTALEAATRAPGASRRLSKLGAQSIEFTCTVWRTRADLDYQFDGVVTGGDVTRALIACGLGGGKAEQSLRVRVNEALKRVSWLEQEPADAPLWSGYFEPETRKLPRSRDDGLNGVVFQVLEDA